MTDDLQEKKDGNPRQSRNFLAFFGRRRRSRSSDLPEKTNGLTEFIGVVWFFLLVVAIYVLIRAVTMRWFHH